MKYDFISFFFILYFLFLYEHQLSTMQISVWIKPEKDLNWTFKDDTVIVQAVIKYLKLWVSVLLVQVPKLFCELYEALKTESWGLVVFKWCIKTLNIKNCSAVWRVWKHNFELKLSLLIVQFSTASLEDPESGISPTFYSFFYIFKPKNLKL